MPLPVSVGYGPFTPQGGASGCEYPPRRGSPHRGGAVVGLLQPFLPTSRCPVSRVTLPVRFSRGHCSLYGCRFGVCVGIGEFCCHLEPEPPLLYFHCPRGYSRTRAPLSPGIQGLLVGGGLRSPSPAHQGGTPGHSPESALSHARQFSSTVTAVLWAGLGPGARVGMDVDVEIAGSGCSVSAG